MAESKKYFWLRLKKDFFKRHDIRIIESMPNGKEYVLFYIKLLTESIDHEGKLRFSDSIPYTAEMLATITNTDAQIATEAIDVLLELEMLSILEDKTYVVNGVQNMIGFETEWAKKKREYRDKTESLKGQHEDKPRTKKDNVRQEIEKELEIEIEKEINNKKDIKHAHGEYAHVKLKDSEMAKLVEEYGQEMTDSCIRFLDEYIEMKGYKAKSHYLCIKKWVVDAVKEKENKNKGKLDKSYDAIAKWAERRKNDGNSNL